MKSRPALASALAIGISCLTWLYWTNAGEPHAARPEGGRTATSGTHLESDLTSDIALRESERLPTPRTAPPAPLDRSRTDVAVTESPRTLGGRVMSPTGPLVKGNVVVHSAVDSRHFEKTSIGEDGSFSIDLDRRRFPHEFVQVEVDDDVATLFSGLLRVRTDLVIHAHHNSHSRWFTGRITLPDVREERSWSAALYPVSEDLYNHSIASTPYRWRAVGSTEEIAMPYSRPVRTADERKVAVVVDEDRSADHSYRRTLSHMSFEHQGEFRRALAAGLFMPSPRRVLRTPPSERGISNLLLTSSETSQAVYVATHLDPDWEVWAPDGDYHVTASSSDGATLLGHIELVTGSTHCSIDWSTRAPGPHRVAVQVSSAAGEPVSDVHIMFRSLDGPVSRHMGMTDDVTDASGHIMVYGLIDSMYLLQPVEREKRWVGQAVITVPGDETCSVRCEPGIPISVRPSPPAELDLDVFDSVGATLWIRRDGADSWETIPAGVRQKGGLSIGALALDGTYDIAIRGDWWGGAIRMTVRDEDNVILVPIVPLTPIRGQVRNHPGRGVDGGTVQVVPHGAGGVIAPWERTLSRGSDGDFELFTDLWSRAEITVAAHHGELGGRQLVRQETAEGITLTLTGKQKDE